MRTIILIIIGVLFTLGVSAQDKIVRLNKTKIFCTITSVDAEKIFFTVEKDGEVLETYIFTKDVLKYKKDKEVVFIATMNQQKDTPKEQPLVEPKKKETNPKIAL